MSGSEADAETVEREPRDADDRETAEGARTPEDDERDPEEAWLDDVDDGCGCTEIWEQVSERRESSAD
ncbi:hypothetical protein BRC90_07240 [Halobacteriales archaeon QS_4_69_34]|nr:MAG: hypothetical protein BRC90_07240 [Halobacteriales archaeon QS_4_69_34]